MDGIIFAVSWLSVRSSDLRLALCSGVNIGWNTPFRVRDEPLRRFSQEILLTTVLKTTDYDLSDFPLSSQENQLDGTPASGPHSLKSSSAVRPGSRGIEDRVLTRAVKTHKASCSR